VGRTGERDEWGTRRGLMVREVTGMEAKGHTQALRDLRSESRAAICISGMDSGKR
jgi:hypothetical protein